MILITGAAGYIGSHCALTFLRAGHKVLVFDSLETGHIETIQALQAFGDIDFEQGDLKNIEDVRSLFDKYDIDGVIHFAAYSLVSQSVKYPEMYFDNNVAGTQNLLDVMIENDVKDIVFSSTAAVYGEPEYTPIDENHPCYPINPYGVSKLRVEKLLQDYDEKFGLKSIRLRYFNVVGADSDALLGEWHEPESHLVPNILKSTFGDSKVFKLYGQDYDTEDGTCIRDYINVEDLVEAHKLAYSYLKKEQKSDVFNLGTQYGNSVKQVFDTCEQVVNKKILFDIESRRDGDPAVLLANAAKAKDVLGWHCQKSLLDSISSAYRWEIKLQELI